VDFARERKDDDEDENEETCWRRSWRGKRREKEKLKRESQSDCIFRREFCKEVRTFISLDLSRIDQ